MFVVKVISPSGPKYLVLDAGAPAIMLVGAFASDLKRQRLFLDDGSRLEQREAFAYRREGDQLVAVGREPDGRLIELGESPHLGAPLRRPAIPFPSTGTGTLGDAIVGVTVLVEAEKLWCRATVLATPHEVMLAGGRRRPASLTAARIDPRSLPAGPLAFPLAPSGAAWTAGREGPEMLLRFAAAPRPLLDEFVAQVREGAWHRIIARKDGEANGAPQWEGGSFV